MRNGKDEAPVFLRTSRTDLVLIAVVVAFSVVVGIWTAREEHQPESAAQRAFIYHDRRLITAVDLDKDGVFPILHDHMRVEVKGGRLRIFYSDCPRHICMHAGWISKAGQTLVCVPNHVLIEIRSATTPAVDAVTY